MKTYGVLVRPDMRGIPMPSLVTHAMRQIERMAKADGYTLEGAETYTQTRIDLADCPMQVTVRCRARSGWPSFEEIERTDGG